MVRGLNDHLTEKAQRACAEMLPTKENAPAATEAGFETKLNRYYKRLPPYGKQLMAIREAGQVPSKTVMVCFDWTVARAYPRIIIPADANPADLKFSFLAGIPVQIVYRRKDAHRVDALVQEILLVNPSLLAAWALDLVGTAPVVTLIKPCESTNIAGDA
jgi:hypothetical protein